MAPETKHLEVTLETQVESVNLAEEMCLRVAEAAGFGEDDCYRIGMSVREAPSANRAVQTCVSTLEAL